MRWLLVRVINRLRPSRHKPPKEAYVRLATLASRYRGTSDGSDLTAHEYKVFSQNGEDGVVCELLRRVGVDASYFVEFGVGGGLECNTLYLAEVLGWRGMWIESSGPAAAALHKRWVDRPQVTVVQAFVTPGNVNELFRSHAVPHEPDLVSIDIDGNDYYVWEALEFRPRLLIVEYNGSLPTDRETRWVQPYSDKTSAGTDYFGASLGAMEALGARKGYRLAHTDLTGVNAFFVREDLLPAADLTGDPPRRRANYYFSGVGWPRDRSGRQYERV